MSANSKSGPFEDLAAVFLDGVLDPRTANAASAALEGLLSHQKIQERVCQVVLGASPRRVVEALTPSKQLTAMVFAWEGVHQLIEVFHPDSTTRVTKYSVVVDPKTSTVDNEGLSSWAAARGGSSTLRVSAVVMTALLRKHGFLVFGGVKFSRYCWEPDYTFGGLSQSFWLRCLFDSDAKYSDGSRGGYFPAVAYLRKYPSGPNYHLYTLGDHQCPCWVNPQRAPDRSWKPVFEWEAADVESLEAADAIVKERLRVFGY